MKSFRLARNKNGKIDWSWGSLHWPYGWLASLVLLGIGLTSFGTFNEQYYTHHNGFWYSTLLGAGGGLFIALIYNALAKFFGWQRIDPVDIAWFDIPY